LADLSLESEAGTALMLRLARAYDQAGDERERAFARIATAVAKFWMCKRAPQYVAEALECLGGNGYVEESIMPRLYREAPLNSIWEGSGNVMCLDVLRAIQREPKSLEALRAELSGAKALHADYDRFLQRVEADLQNADDAEVRARHIVENLALALQASVLLKTNESQIADAFIASRLADRRSGIYGTLPTGTRFRTLIDRVGYASA
jgi:putative acyl-CoA dehydrogenase